MARVIVATVKSWNVRRYNEWAARGQHISQLIQEPAALTVEIVSAFAPDYIFFPHWSWKIPAELYERYECVVFHMTDLPFGRGGSPLQNLILQGISDTQVSALRVVETMDAGPIYAKRPLSLYGSASEIYIRAAGLIFQMIDDILEQRPTPIPQKGGVVEFKRRTPAQSQIPAELSLNSLYDFLRMLDAEGYPPAFLIHGGFRYEFARAILRDGHVVADVKISPVESA